MQFFNLDGLHCFKVRTGLEGLEIKHFPVSITFKWKPMYLISLFLFFLNGPWATQQHSLFRYPSPSGPLAMYLDIVCKSPADLHDDTSRHGQETWDARTESLLVMNVAGADTLCFPGWFWLSGEINAWKMMDTSLYSVIYWAVTAGIFLWHSLV